VRTHAPEIRRDRDGASLRHAHSPSLTRAPQVASDRWSPRVDGAYQRQRSFAFEGISIFPVDADTIVSTERYQFSTTIRLPRRERDSGGPTPDAPTGQVATGEPESIGEELAEGQTGELRVFTSSYPEDPDTDSVVGNLTYSPSVTVSPDEPKDKKDFGSTWGNHIRTAKGGRIHRGTAGFEVTLTYENPIVIRVFKDAGPRGQTNIESDTDPNIKAGNYPKVASDLTPGPRDVPPRGQFWSRDLTLIHEGFHAKDGKKFCGDAVAAEQAALSKQTASTVAEVNALLKPIPDRVIAARAKGMAPPGNEDRAYADGAAAYRSRADKIRARGKAGKYTASLDLLFPEEDVGVKLAEDGEPSLTEEVTPPPPESVS
jgi:hypothetical protein